MSKLTLEKCFLYPNAKIELYREDSTDAVFGNIFDLISVVSENTTNEDGNVCEREEFENILTDCTLQLRKLSSLTEDEKKFIVDNYSFRGRLWGNDLFDSVTMLIINCIPEKRIECVDQFRKWNIDIDGLIQSGVAEEVR